VSVADLSAWCERWLGASPAAEIFHSQKISDVAGLVLTDGRAVVVKVREASPRVEGCVRVQALLHHAGFPCAEPLAGPAPFGTMVATAERYVAGGTALARGARGARRYAEELARAVRILPPPDQLPSLEPPPYWATWDHRLSAIWPPDPNVDLNSREGPPWLDDAGARVRRRLARAWSLPPVIGHVDWESQNLRWTGEDLLVAHDWDSAIARPEAIIAGMASLMFPSTGPTNEPATLDESEAFLAAYEKVRGEPFSADEREVAWAAGLWIGTWKAKKATYYGDTGVVLGDLEQQLSERLMRAGA
jgi:hypothetical protein